MENNLVKPKAGARLLPSICTGAGTVGAILAWASRLGGFDECIGMDA